jgi:hypothetical protein
MITNSFQNFGVTLCTGGFIIGISGLQGLLAMISRQAFVDNWGNIWLSIVIGMGTGCIASHISKPE